MNLTIPSDPRSRKLLAGALASLAVFGGYWWKMWSPDQAEIVSIAAHADTVEALNARNKRDVENGSEAKLRADAEMFNSQLVVLRRLVPTQNEVPALIDAISTAARQSGMDMNDIAPDGELPGDQFNAIKYRLSVTGPYHKVAEFLTSVGSLSRIITPINVQLSPFSRVGQMERKPGKNETFIDAKFSVLTYVAKTAATPPAAAPAKPGTK